MLTRTAAERLGIPLWHYADYPYLIYGEHNLADWVPTKAETFSLEITPMGLKAWQDGFACQRSQIPLLWVDEEDMRASIRNISSLGMAIPCGSFND